MLVTNGEDFSFEQARHGSAERSRIEKILAVGVGEIKCDVDRNQGPEQWTGEKNIQLRPGAPIQGKTVPIVGIDEELDFFNIVRCTDGENIAKAWNGADGG
jgi:hypothetical protein